MILPFWFDVKVHGRLCLWEDVNNNNLLHPVCSMQIPTLTVVSRRIVLGKVHTLEEDSEIVVRGQRSNTYCTTTNRHHHDLRISPHVYGWCHIEKSQDSSSRTLQTANNTRRTQIFWWRIVNRSCPYFDEMMGSWSAFFSARQQKARIEAIARKNNWRDGGEIMIIMTAGYLLANGVATRFHVKHWLHTTEDDFRVVLCTMADRSPWRVVCMMVCRST